jgi:RNA polymerase sigma-70 factor (ECF subfamily)
VSSKQPDAELELDRYRSYLLLLARVHLEHQKRQKIEASDVVQQTLFEAYQQRAKLPANEEQLCAWLRTALANNLRDQRKFNRRLKRDVQREQSQDEALMASSRRLVQRAVTLRPTPSQAAMRAEDVVRLAEALWQLPPAQREAIIRHHLEGCPLSETAEKLGKSEAAVAGLLHRGLRQLRKTLTANES